MVSTPDNMAPDESPDDDGTLIDRGLTPRQEQAIIALISEAGVTKASAVTGIPERTIYNWLEQPKFRSAYLNSRRRSYGHAVGLCGYYAPMAVQTLAKVMSDPQAPHSARVSAAINMLKAGREGIELDELVMRIEALEKAQQAVSSGGGGGGGGRYNGRA
jgi:hypothetical protein